MVTEFRNNANISQGASAPPGALVPEDTERLSDLEAKPLSELFAPLYTFLLNTSEKIKSLDKDENLERLRFVVKLRKYYMCHQLGRVSELDNEWKQVSKKRGNRLYVDPQLSYFVDSTLSQFVKSNPQVRIYARNQERFDKKKAAEYAQANWEDFKRSQLKFSYNLREGRNFLLCAESYRHTWFKRDVKGTEVPVPVHEERTVKGRLAAWQCPLCLEGGEMPEEMRAQVLDGDATTLRWPCPKCGHAPIEIIAAKPVQVKAHTGYKEVPAGDSVSEVPDPLEMTASNRAYTIDDSPFLSRDRMIMRGILEDFFDADLPASTSTPTHLKYQEQLQKSTGGPEGEGVVIDESPQGVKQQQGGEQFELLHFREVWLDRSLYTSYRLPENTRLPKSGVVLKKGSYLKEHFPNGMYFCHVGNKIKDIRPENKSDTWVHSPYWPGDGFHGMSPFFNLVPLQDQRNELRSCQFNKVMFDSFTPTLVRKSALEGSKLENRPDAVYNVTNFPDEYSLANVMHRVPPGQPLTEAYQLDHELANSQQNLAGNSSLMGGAPDMQGSPSRKALSTAMGVGAVQEQSNVRMLPPLGLRGEMIERQVKQVLKQRQENWPEAMYERIDRQVGGDAGRWFRECDVDRDLVIEVILGTVLPLTEQQKREDLAAMTAYVDPNDPNARKAIQKRAAEIYGTSGFDLASYQKDTFEAQIRLERVKALALTLETDLDGEGQSVYDADGQPHGELVNIVLRQAAVDLEILREFSEEQFPFVPVQPVLDRHPQYREVYGNWLLSNEGRDATTFQRKCIHDLILFHFDAEVLQQQGGTARALETRLPEKVASDVMGREQQEGEQAAEAAKAEGKLAIQQAKDEAKLAMQMEQHGHEQEMQANQPEPQGAVAE